MFWKELLKGIWKQNPVLVIMLGMCPTLATSGNARNALGMGLATTFVLACSNVVISLIRKIVPQQIRIPCYIVVIAAFVTIVDFLMQAYAPQAVYKELGIFISLIVVNCIVLGRAEAFASKNGPLLSFADGLGMGLGFTFALVILGTFREFIGAGTIFQIKIIPGWTEEFSIMTKAPGGFIMLGFLLAAMNIYNFRRSVKRGEICKEPLDVDCHHCHICMINKNSSENE